MGRGGLGNAPAGATPLMRRAFPIMLKILFLTLFLIYVNKKVKIVIYF
jgi:hypothetical protein